MSAHLRRLLAEVRSDRAAAAENFDRLGALDLSNTDDAHQGACAE